MLTFKRNMNTLDRTIRATVGSTLLLLGPLTDVVVLDSLSNTILGVLGCMALGSAALSYCFLYELTGFCTLKDAS
jgi:hypothetical protein